MSYPHISDRSDGRVSKRSLEQDPRCTEWVTCGDSDHTASIIHQRPCSTPLGLTTRSLFRPSVFESKNIHLRPHYDLISQHIPMKYVDPTDRSAPSIIQTIILKQPADLDGLTVMLLAAHGIQPNHAIRFLCGVSRSRIHPEKPMDLKSGLSREPSASALHKLQVSLPIAHSGWEIV